MNKQRSILQLEIRNSAFGKPKIINVHDLLIKRFVIQQNTGTEVMTSGLLMQVHGLDISEFDLPVNRTRKEVMI